MTGFTESAFTPDATLVITPQDYALLTDLYELTMSACYVGENLAQARSSFELTVRRLPTGFGYLIAMGLAQGLEYLQTLRFSADHIRYLQATGIFAQAPAAFWQLLTDARFEGDVWAVPEGTAVFANEPLLRVEAPLWQAQLVETYLLNTLNYQTLIATRAARLRDVVGPDQTLLEFGSRRAFSPPGLALGRAGRAGRRMHRDVQCPGGLPARSSPCGNHGPCAGDGFVGDRGDRNAGLYGVSPDLSHRCIVNRYL